MSQLDVKLLGRDIGTASGWDEWSDNGMIYYDLVPTGEYANLLTPGDWAVDFTEGTIGNYNDEGERLIEFDLIQLFSESIDSGPTFS